jgi:hypothetical protein
LVAIGKDKKGKELNRSQKLKSPNDNLRLSVDLEKDKLNANGKDLEYININFTDDQGIAKVMEKRKVIN